MSSSNTSAVPSPSPEKKRRYLSAEKKFQIYLEAQVGDKPVGELLRREGLFSTDLVRIRQQVKEGALQRLGAKPGRQQGHVSTEVHEALSANSKTRNERWPTSRLNWRSCEKKRMGVRGTDNRPVVKSANQTGNPHRD